MACRFVRSIWSVRGWNIGHLARWFAETNGEGFTLEAVTPIDVKDYKRYLMTVAKAKPATGSTTPQFQRFGARTPGVKMTRCSPMRVQQRVMVGSKLTSAASANRRISAGLAWAFSSAIRFFSPRPVQDSAYA